MTDAIRLVAGLAAVALIAAPAIMAGYRKAAAWLRESRPEAAPEATGVGIAEMRTVLELANKLRSAGLVDGVALCQQLLDVMLGNQPKAKK
jgi:hypothetical protein